MCRLLSIDHFLSDSVTAELEGWAGCFAVSVTGWSSAVARLAVRSSPAHQPPPVIQLGPVNQTVSRGNLLTLHCQYTARDKARVAWLKEGIPIEFSDNDRYYLTDGYNLQIKGIKLLYKYSQSSTADNFSTLLFRPDAIYKRRQRITATSLKLKTLLRLRPAIWCLVSGDNLFP